MLVLIRQGKLPAYYTKLQVKIKGRPAFVPQTRRTPFSSSRTEPAHTIGKAGLCAILDGVFDQITYLGFGELTQELGRIGRLLLLEALMAMTECPMKFSHEL